MLVRAEHRQAQHTPSRTGGAQRETTESTTDINIQNKGAHSRELTRHGKKTPQQQNVARTENWQHNTKEGSLRI
jgi:hypothetical protein